MITAVVLINTEANLIPEAAQAIANVPGIAEVYSVTGEVDLIAIAKVRRHEDLAGVIADRVSKTPGVASTQTFIAFQTYSTGDLDEAYDLGLGD
ncbi:MAG: Lrp/AsnC ligand binding domain-containing protein [Bifidobacteriaceae bacterium]|jgi:DNA-binding Lrp family transcriptional regulator|nr:Lrp/AsnC ligand binding domain-containing protein [Bifidobacteriaceae bacterium]